MDNPILDPDAVRQAQMLQRLPAPALASVSGMVPNVSPLSGAPAPVLPNVTQGPPSPLTSKQITSQRLLGDQNELQRLSSTGDGISQIKNPLLHGLARFGDVAESILLPGAASFTPGTSLNHQRLLGQQKGLVNNDLANQQQQATTGQTEANTAYLAARPDIEQSKIDQKQTAVQERVGQAAAAKGQLVSWDENGIPTFTDDHTSQAFADHQALSAMHQATADKSKIMADIASNHFIPGTPEFDEAQRKLAQVDKRMQVAMAGLGLRSQSLDLRRQNMNASLYGKDNAGNDLPGAAQITGDEGQATTVGSKFAPAAIKQQSAVGTFNDLGGSIRHAANALHGIDLSDPNVAAVMADPGSLAGKIINGKFVQPTLTPEQLTGINAVRQLHEQAGILRKVTGGTAAEAQAQRILDTVPVAGDSPAMIASKLSEIQQVMGRLTPAMTHVQGGLSVRPTGAPAATETRSYQGHTYVKGPSGWHLQQ